MPNSLTQLLKGAKGIKFYMMGKPTQGSGIGVVNFVMSLMGAEGLKYLTEQTFPMIVFCMLNLEGHIGQGFDPLILKLRSWHSHQRLCQAKRDMWP